MGDPYVAIRVSRDEFVNDYPDAVAVPIGELGFAAFGSAPVHLQEKLSRPDFDQTQMFLVLVRDDPLYLAFAAAGDVVGYPPDHVRLRVSDWGQGVDPDWVRSRVHDARDTDVWSGELVSSLQG